MISDEIKGRIEDMINSGEFKASLSADINGNDTEVSIGGHGLAEIVALTLLCRHVANQMEFSPVELLGMVNGFWRMMDLVDLSEGMPS